MFMARLSHRFAVLGVETVTSIFWFAGFVALAVYVGRLIICNGGVCNALRTVVAFAAFEWYVS